MLSLGAPGQAIFEAPYGLGSFYSGKSSRGPLDRFRAREPLEGELRCGVVTDWLGVSSEFETALLSTVPPESLGSATPLPVSGVLSGEELEVRVELPV